jgi:hypothetical protein
MKQKKEKTTLLFVNTNQKAFKPMQVSNGLILHWKKYLTCTVLIFLSLVAAIIYLVSLQDQQALKQIALSKKLHNMHAVISKVDTASLKKKFAKINTELSSINSYLKARGIKPVIEPEGGEADDDIISSDEISDFYIKYINHIGNEI